MVSFATAGVFSGVWWLRWARHGASDNMWPLLGWFSGLLCVGSVAGCVAWGAATQSNSVFFELFEPGITRVQFYTLNSSYNRWQTAFYIPNGLEFLCLIIAKLLLLGRLARDAARILRDEEQEMSGVRASWRDGRALPMLYTVFASAVTLCSVVGMVAYTAGGVYNSQGSRLYDQAAAACDPLGGDTNSSRLFAPAIDDKDTLRYDCLAVQSVSEATALLLISGMYLVLVTLSVSIFREAEKVAARALVATQPNSASTTAAAAIVGDAMRAAAEQRRRLTLACVVVLISFPCRIAFDLLQAYATYNVQVNALCPSPCGACRSYQYVRRSLPAALLCNIVDMYVVRAWLAYTPEFQPLVVAFSSPLPLTVSLWLITAAHTRALALQAAVQQYAAGDDDSTN
jgi:hypothetical protein